MIDWSVRLGDIVIIISLAGSGLLYAFRSGKFAESIDRMQEDIVDLKEVAKKITDILTSVAVQSQRLDTDSQRLDIMDRKIEDLRRGNGWITRNSRRGVDGEYP